MATSAPGGSERTCDAEHGDLPRVRLGLAAAKARGLDEIDRHLCLAFKAHIVREAADLRAALEAGADLRDHRNRRRQPLAVSSIKRLVSVLAMVLDEAIDDELIERNPARGKRMRVRVPKPSRSFLELDELAALLEAAAAEEALPSFAAETLAGEGTAGAVARPDRSRQAPHRHRRRASAHQVDGQLPSRPPRRHGAGRLHRPPRGDRGARPKRGPGERAMNPAVWVELGVVGRDRAQVRVGHKSAMPLRTRRPCVGRIHAVTDSRTTLDG